MHPPLEWHRYQERSTREEHAKCFLEQHAGLGYMLKDLKGNDAVGDSVRKG